MRGWHRRGVRFLSWTGALYLGALAVPGLSHAISDGGVPPQAAWNSTLSKLGELQAQQKAVLGNLLTLQQKLDAAKRLVVADQSTYAQDERRLQITAASLGQVSQEHQAKVQATAHLLRLVQYMGPASYLGVLLGAKDWTEFARGLGAVSFTVHALNQQLASLKAESKTMAADVQQIQQTGVQAQAALHAAQSAEQTLSTRQQALNQSLAGLGSQRTFYTQALNQLQSQWVALITPYLQLLKTALAQLPESSAAMTGASVAFTAQGVSVEIPQDLITQAVEAQPGLGNLTVSLAPGAATLRDASKGLTIVGTFQQLGSTRVAFQLQSVDFGGVPLNSAVVRAAMGSSTWAIDLTPLLQGGQIQSVAVVQGNLVVQVDNVAL